MAEKKKPDETVDDINSMEVIRSLKTLTDWTKGLKGAEVLLRALINKKSINSNLDAQKRSIETKITEAKKAYDEIQDKLSKLKEFEEKETRVVNLRIEQVKENAETNKKICSTEAKEYKSRMNAELEKYKKDLSKELEELDKKKTTAITEASAAQTKRNEALKALEEAKSRIKNL